MATTETNSDERTRQDVLEAFTEVVNVTRPEHPDFSDPYPISPENVEYSYCQRTGQYLAKCGPRYGVRGYVVFFAVDTHYASTVSNERLLALLVHEATHIHVGYHSHSSAHPMKFWREYTFYGMELLDNLEGLERILGPIDEDELREQLVNDPNSATVDRRSNTVEEVQLFIEQYIGTGP